MPRVHRKSIKKWNSEISSTRPRAGCMYWKGDAVSEVVHIFPNEGQENEPVSYLHIRQRLIQRSPVTERPM